MYLKPQLPTYIGLLADGIPKPVIQMLYGARRHFGKLRHSRRIAMDSSTIFQLYRNYAETVRKKAAEKVRKPMKDALCEDDFARVWRSLPNSERRHWEERFKAGFELIILSESSQYASVLSNDDSTSLKAA
ncbi:MAG: hypothetical protein ACI9HK_002131 [Pirellulaceae bacterium]